MRLFDKSLWGNLVSLSSVQALNYVLPLFTLPYLTHVLGAREWGTLAFAEAFAAYSSILIDFGFGFSATRDLVQIRGDRAEQSRLLASVIGAQCILFVLAALITVGVLTIPGMYALYGQLLPVALITAFLRSIFPGWYFQGMERMKLISIFTVIANVAGAGGVFLVARSDHDALHVMWLRLSLALFCALSGLAFVYRDLSFQLPEIKKVFVALRSSFRMFLFGTLISLYTTANVLLLGFMAAPIVVSGFAAAERLVKAAAACGIGSIAQVLYPRISHLVVTEPEEAMRTVRSSIFVTVAVALVMGAGLYFAAPWLLPRLFGKQFAGATPVLRILSFLPAVIAVSNVYGIQWMLPLRMEKQFTIILGFSAVANILLAWKLVPSMGAVGMALAVFAAELIVTLGVVAFVRAKGLDPFQKRRSALRAKTPLLVDESAQEAA